MTDFRSITPSCDRHPNDVARVLCRCHRKLLCVSCGFERATVPECKIVEIKKLSTERDRLLVESLAVKQLAIDKKRLVERHDTNLESMRSNLEQQVLDEHFKLIKRLDKLKDDSLMSIETQTEAITNTNKQIKQKLASIENTAGQNINTLSSTSPLDTNNVKLKIQEVKSDLMNNIQKRNLRPEGYFQLNTVLYNAVLQEDASFGHVIMIDDEDCEKKDKFLKRSTEDKTQDAFNREQQHRTESSKTEVNRRNSEPFKRPTLHVQFSSDEVSCEKDCDYLRPVSDPGITSYFRGSEYDEPYSPLTTSCYVENPYHELDSDPSSSITAEYFVDKTVAVSANMPLFYSACKFCHLVYLGGSLIGLLSKVHNSVIIVGLDGLVLNKKTMISDLVNIASAGKDKMALLTEKGHQVCIVDVNSVGCSTSDSFLVKERFEKITGFDFDVDSSLFAISSPDKLVLLDKTGRAVTQHTYRSTSTSSREIVSVYDFRKSYLYIMNIQNRTLKCLNVTTGNARWKFKYDDSTFIPRSMCLYNDTLCIMCKDVIVQLFAEDGSLFMRHDAKSIMEDCLGVCVIDDIIVFSSNSNDFEASTKLAYKKLT